MLQKHENDAQATPAQTASDYLTIMLGGQMFGIPVLKVQDVLGPQKITAVPLGPKAVAGVLNLRGRIVTAIDVRRCLGLPPLDAGQKNMSVVVNHDEELFSLIIDSVGDVLPLDHDALENTPPTLDPLWRGISEGVCQLKDRLLVVLDITRLLAAAENMEDARPRN